MGPVLAPLPEGQGSTGRPATSKATCVFQKYAPPPVGERLVEPLGWDDAVCFLLHRRPAD